MIAMQKTKFMKRIEKGFTLLEVLVALVLLGFGFISMLMLQYRSLQHSNAAYYQGISSQIVGGLAASMRANPEASTTTAGYGHVGGALTGTGCINSGADCSADQIAKADLFWAQQAVAAQLPGGDIRVVYAAADASYDVYILWQNQEKDNQTDASMQLTCNGITTFTVPSGAACLSTRVRVGI